MAEDDPPYISLWKAEIKKSHIATCPHCSLSFLSIGGVVNHLSKCIKFLPENGFVSCNFCDAKFSLLKSLQRHVAKSHYPMSSHNAQTNTTSNKHPRDQLTHACEDQYLGDPGSSANIWKDCFNADNALAR